MFMVGHPRVLVVDDDVAIRETLHDVLESAGYKVGLAENGARALESMRTDAPDVVVLDLMMPVMSGWEVLEAAEEEAELRSIPILVISAMAAPVADGEREGGVRMCLPKPLELDVLLAALDRLTAH
jgi:CheY-like chemotaxis protein